MKIVYIDNYEEELLDTDSPYMPRIGDSVYISDSDEWIVTKVYWYADSNTGVVQMTLVEEMPIIREDKQSDESARHKEVQSAIVAIQNGQDELHKKHRRLREQISSVRTRVNQQAHKESKS